jgi:hypothetical protein
VITYFNTITPTEYHTLLETQKRDRFPYEWARRQNNLGITYSNHIGGEQADNLEAAIDSFQEALKESKIR